VAIRITKAYRTISFESAIVIAGLTPIELKIEETVKLLSIKSIKIVITHGFNFEYIERKIECLLFNKSNKRLLKCHLSYVFKIFLVFLTKQQKIHII
jgi:hypothetical protein